MRSGGFGFFLLESAGIIFLAEVNQLTVDRV
jgi:hypothetical protein